MDIAERVNGGDVAAGAIAAGAFEFCRHPRRALRVALFQLQQDIGGVRVIADREHFERVAFRMAAARALKNAIHDGARLLRRQVHLLHLAPAPRVSQMIDAEALHVVFQADIEDSVKVGLIKRVDRKAQADLDTPRAAAVNRSQRALERALQPPQFIVPRPDAVHADARVLKSERSQAVGHRLVNQQAVGGERAGEAQRLRVGN